MPSVVTPKGMVVQFRAILASDKEGVIGYDNHLIFKNSEDMAFFSKTTKNHICVMGRATFESIKGVLPMRQTIIMTHNPTAYLPKVQRLRLPPKTPRPIVTDNLFGVLGGICDFYNDPKVYVCGGAQIYRELKPVTMTWIVTQYAAYTKRHADAMAKKYGDEPEQMTDAEKKMMFLPYQYDPEKLTILEPELYTGLFCSALQHGNLNGIRWAIRSYQDTRKTTMLRRDAGIFKNVESVVDDETGQTIIRAGADDAVERYFQDHHADHHALYW